MSGGKLMFNEQKLYLTNTEKVANFFNKKVVSIENIEQNIFRTDYVRDKFSLAEYVERLEEVYNSRKTIGRKLTNYTLIENTNNSELEPAKEKLVKHLFYYIGYTVALILKGEPDENKGFMFYNYGVYENQNIYTTYFEVDTKVSIDISKRKDLLSSILNIENEDFFIRKIDDLYELTLFKNPLAPTSLGDILVNANIEDKEKNGYPIILGKDDKNKDAFIDVATLNSAMVVGEKSYGKSTFINSFLTSIQYLYDESEMSVILLDSKDKKTSAAFGRSPHCLGYHSDFKDFPEIFKEITDEIRMRKSVLAQSELANWKELRKSIVQTRDAEAIAVFPWLVIVLDELQDVLSKLEELGDLLLENQFKECIKTITEESKELGICLVTVSSEALPEFLRSSTEAQIVFKVSEQDWNALGLEGHKQPASAGEFMLIDKIQDNIRRIKGAGLGTFSEDKIAYLMRTIAVDLFNESNKDGLFRSQCFIKTHNRDRIAQTNKEICEQGALFNVRPEIPILNIARALKEGNFGY